MLLGRTGSCHDGCPVEVSEVRWFPGAQFSPSSFAALLKGVSHYVLKRHCFKKLNDSGKCLDMKAKSSTEARMHNIIPAM